MITIRSININTRYPTETKFWQGWLNAFESEKLKVDGGYGELTKQATKRYQAKNGLEPDGNAGQQTLTHAGFLPTKNSKITVLEIPFSRIAKANVLLKDGQAYNCKRFADEGDYDIAWNGAFFNMSNRKIVQFVSIAGQIKQYGMANTGIAYPNNWTNASKATPKTRNQVIGQPLDMQVGAPVLIQNGISNIDKTGIANSIMTQVTERNCTGVKSDSLLLFFTISGCTLYEMRDEGLYQKVVYLQGNDGGGSKGLYMGGGYIFSGRAIPCAVGLRIKPSVTTPAPPNPQPPIPPVQPSKKPKVCLDAGHGIEENGKQSPDGTYYEHEFNLDMAKRMQAILTHHGVEVTLTRKNEHQLDKTGDPDLSARVKIANSIKDLNLFVSIHSNAFGNGKEWTSPNGYVIFTSAKGDNAERNKAAKAILTRVKEAGITLRPYPHVHELFYVLRNPVAPAVLIEHGFHTNKEEVAMLKTDAYRNKLAEANCKGILDYLGIEWKMETRPETEHWAKPYLDSLVKKGIVVSSEQHQDLDAPITKGQLFVMLDKISK